jgi:hypothetical protein
MSHLRFGLFEDFEVRWFSNAETTGTAKDP